MQEDVQKLIDNGYLTVKKHPEADLYIYNYTRKTQYENLWNEITLTHRGLIKDKNDNIVSRPFRKFFNIEELPLVGLSLPHALFDVYDKLDGSLGISYWYNGKPWLATRGSFDGEQALHGSKILQEKYKEVKLNPKLTYLFEIIYPENRIVVDYKGIDDITLLAVIDTQNKGEFNLDDIDTPFPKAKKSVNGASTLYDLKDLNYKNQEGFVIYYPSMDFRVKVKFEWYQRMHRLLSGITETKIWEILSCYDDPENIYSSLENDEIFHWIKQIRNKLLMEHKNVIDIVYTEFKDFGDRKENAMYYKTCSFPYLMFLLLDKEDRKFREAVWKTIKPKNNLCGEGRI